MVGVQEAEAGEGIHELWLVFVDVVLIKDVAVSDVVSAADDADGIGVGLQFRQMRVGPSLEGHEYRYLNAFGDLSEQLFDLFVDRFRQFGFERFELGAG